MMWLYQLTNGFTHFTVVALIRLYGSFHSCRVSQEEYGVDDADKILIDDGVTATDWYSGFSYRTSVAQEGRTKHACVHCVSGE